MSKNKEIEAFFIHFDTRGEKGEVVHQIQFKTLSNVEQSLEKVLAGLNEKFFDKKLNIEVLALTAEDGGFF
jgi:hypothetical protein